LTPTLETLQEQQNCAFINEVHTRLVLIYIWFEEYLLAGLKGKNGLIPAFKQVLRLLGAKPVEISESSNLSPRLRVDH
jgi:hypothetical protein